ncbi:MAG TPA: hypothetical protein VGM90_07160 [Kofleriaceae bacterium]|jgi:hypothetical protein
MGRFEDAPETYWHWYVGEEFGWAIPLERDMTKTQLRERLIAPWASRVPFVVNGTVFADHNKIKQVKIVQTTNRSEHYVANATSLMPSMAVFNDGEDFTSEALGSAMAGKAPSAEVALLLTACSRLAHAAKPLERRRSGKQPLVIDDEYDVQDLLHAILRSYFKYTVAEEPLKKLANAKSTRVDFALEDLGVVVEVKYVHGPNDQQRIVTDFAEDVLFYEQWDPLKVFIYVVYRSSDLQDPEALDKLSSSRKRGDKAYDVFVVRA